jgi:signal transduction histidine kinase/CheY-like chemotaxis protein/HPt (histidine-containing phosphotransfer) domain-containing protein
MNKLREFLKTERLIIFLRLMTIISIVILIMLTIFYTILSRNKEEQAFQTSDLLVDQIKNVILANERKELSLTESLKENYISKAKAVAYIVDNIPDTEYDVEELTRVANLMSIDEIHLFTAEGEIYSGTVPKYYGFTFDSGEQMAYFKPMLTDKTLSMCQDVTPNTAESKPMMYAICWNDGGTRIIQVGIEPKRLIEELQSNEISQVVANIPAYEGVDILVAQKETHEIVGSTEEDHIGCTLADIGLGGEIDQSSETVLTHFTGRIEDGKCYCSMQDLGKYTIIVAQYLDVVNREIPFTLLLIFVYLMVAATALAVIVQRTTQRRERLQAISENAIAASEAKTSFLSNMSHEIRTPINAILGMNEMIMRESSEEDMNIRMYSQSIKTAGNTLLGIVNDILDFSKIEEGKLELFPVDYDLSSVVNDLVNMIKIRLDDKGLFLKLEIDKETPRMLRGDEIRIKQIITNILTNAAKYTEKGSVTFRVGYRKIEDDPDAVFLMVSVKDTGIGIRPEDIQKLFSRFERIEEKRNRSIEGTGLGMNITKMLLEMMGSRLEVESTYGEGSEFSFSVRQEVVEWEPIGDYETTWKNSVRSMSDYKESFVAPDAEILVVDDNSLNLMVFVSLLKQTRIKIDEASSGDDAIALALKKHYDVIFLDHMMPEKDGIETLHELKNNPACPNLDTPYICLTANAISGAKEEYIAAGFNDYLTKPIDTDELENTLICYLPEDKVLKVDEEEGESYASASESGSSVALDALEGLNDAGIDVSKGITNNGTLDVYISVLDMFCESIDEKKAEIEEAYSAGNIKDYTIKVHALKSSARIIGAAAFGEEAQQLEDAGKAGDIDYIRENHEAFLEEFVAFREPIKKSLDLINTDSGEDNTPRRTADEADMEMFYERMRFAAEDMDCDLLGEIYDAIKDFDVPEDDRELLDQLGKAVKNYDYGGILGLLQNRQK